jgi:hypothetical protein
MYRKAQAYKPDSSKLSNRCVAFSVTLLPPKRFPSIFEMELAVIQGVAHQPRRRSKRSPSHRSGVKTSPYDTSRSKGKTGKRVGNDVLGELTNSPKKRIEELELDMPVFTEGIQNQTPTRARDSPAGVDWFMAPRKGAIGKAR